MKDEQGENIQARRRAYREVGRLQIVRSSMGRWFLSVMSHCDHEHRMGDGEQAMMSVSARFTVLHNSQCVSVSVSVSYSCLLFMSVSSQPVLYSPQCAYQCLSKLMSIPCSGSHYQRPVIKSHSYNTWLATRAVHPHLYVAMTFSKASLARHQKKVRKWKPQLPSRAVPVPVPRADLTSVPRIHGPAASPTVHCHLSA